MEEPEAMREEAQNILKIKEENRVKFNNRRNYSRKYEVRDVVSIKGTEFAHITKQKEKYFGHMK